MATAETAEQTAQSSDGDPSRDSGEFLKALAAKITVPTTLTQSFVEAVTSRSGTALRYKEHELAAQWAALSYPELGERVTSLAKGLIALGVEPGERIAILSDTRPEWTIADYAGLCAGAVVVPVYQTNSPEECQYVLEHSDAKLVFVENPAQLAKIDEVRDQLPELKHAVAFENAGGSAQSLDDLRDRGAEVSDETLAERIMGAGPDDLFTLIYTSGTTGPPKGCMLTHGNYVANIEQVKASMPVPDGATFYVFLPLAHALTRMVQTLAVNRGSTIAYWQRDPLKLVEDLGEVQPTHLPCVPRIFEKIYGKATGDVAEEGGPKEKIFNWALDIGREYHRANHEGDGAGPKLSAQHALADKLVFSKVREKFGGRVEHCVSGGAPIDPEILEFFHAVGIPIYEGYGMTEASAGATFNTPDEYRFGTVGKPVHRMEVAFAEDGELLMRGPNVFQGYFKNEKATEETLIDGWLHSGDIGTYDDDGYVKITGRKKELIITAAGKNIGPTNIENQIKQSPWISQAVIFGDRKPYLVGLIALDAEQAPKLAESIGAPSSIEAMLSDGRVRAEVQNAVNEANSKFARVEQVKKWDFLPRELTQEEGEMTPTMKTKRNVVYERYAQQFEGLYHE